MAYDYKILVRSYKRPKQVCTHTLNMLSRQVGNLLSKTIVLVADGVEAAEYRKEIDAYFPFSHGIRVHVTEKGAAKAYNWMLTKVIPIGHPVFFIDDDIKQFIEYPKLNEGLMLKNEILDLDRYIQFGFAQIKKHGAGAFSFDYGNPWFKMGTPGAPFAKIGMFRIPGGFFGAFNVPELIVNTDHEEDNVRAAQLLDFYGKNMIFNWFDVKMAAIGSNAGGMQADGSRDNCAGVCEEALKIPCVAKFFKNTPVVNEKLHITTLKYKGFHELKKLVGYKPPIKYPTYFGEEEMILGQDIWAI